MALTFNRVGSTKNQQCWYASFISSVPPVYNSILYTAHIIFARFVHHSTTSPVKSEPPIKESVNKTQELYLLVYLVYAYLMFFTDFFKYSRNLKAYIRPWNVNGYSADIEIRYHAQKSTSLCPFLIHFKRVQHFSCVHNHEERSFSCQPVRMRLVTNRWNIFHKIWY